ncbi:hypothetical protein CVT24_008941 [Panaeolus cyanescens]|uniref:Uncharacterized protein n=1 Tax=Panaeolus cyanescens TaxID=181874 RepID=A0A409YAW5_9AGAR|nr:hypothetical protein CVT24_008941 [Panaeolus cyanescens]
MASNTSAGKKRKLSNTTDDSEGDERARFLEYGAKKIKLILANASSSDELLELAVYARLLEEENEALRPRPKTAADIAEEADRLRTCVRSGIRKQMKWTQNSCYEGQARFVYDGLCDDADVFGEMLGLGGPPKFKKKTFRGTDLNLGELSVRMIHCDFLYQRGDITVQWPGDGTFKIIGRYGV